ncbi:hypothetical protein G9A89_001219 [Geosiphon pyriformis]|nr:hypothetical protein G9A89_001219 [Geosiphon pyriformis]
MIRAKELDFEVTSEKLLQTRYKSINDLMIDENFSLKSQLGWTELRRQIGHRRKGIPPAHNLSFVGHGLGGVFVVLGAFELLTVKAPELSQIEVYTYGEPRFGKLPIRS